jgi:fructose-1,6-bisphosphatase I
MADRVTNIRAHIYQRQAEFPGASGEFSGLLNDIALAAKIIAQEVNKAGLVDILGATGTTNVQGEQVRKLDILARDVLVKILEPRQYVRAIATEEDAEMVPLTQELPHGDYAVVIDPLDGSSNIEANVSIGTIFGIYRRTGEGEDVSEADVLQAGRSLSCAGYVIYGSSTMFVYTTGVGGVHGFTLDPGVGEFLLSHPNIQMPERGKIYSINEGYSKWWKPHTREYVEHLKAEGEGRPYSSRYIGSLVADFHRNLLYGGVFLYPEDTRDPGRPTGKLRLLYEAAPLAFVAEAAGGRASTGFQQILDIVPEHLHERVPLILGSRMDVEEYEAFCSRSTDPTRIS